MSRPVLFKPPTRWVEALQVGDQALTCFGAVGVVEEIFGRGINRNGAAFVCCYVQHGGSTISMGFVAGEVTRTVAASNAYTSAELDMMDHTPDLPTTVEAINLRRVLRGSPSPARL